LGYKGPIAWKHPRVCCLFGTKTRMQTMEGGKKKRDALAEGKDGQSEPRN